MTNILRYSASILLLSTMPALAQTYSDAGTAYSNATVDQWTEDRINDYVQMADSFACILSKSRPEMMPNATYEALISEVDCGLEDEVINASGVSNRTKLSSSVIKSSKASIASAQEGLFWFDAMSGNKFIGNMILTKGPAASPPYGEWSIGYYMNAMTDATSDTFTSLTSPIRGYVDIEGQSDGSTILRTYDAVDMTSLSICGGAGNQACTEDLTQSAKIQYFDSTLASTRVLGRTVGVSSQNQALDVVVAAKTNANQFYRAVFSGGTDPTAAGYVAPVGQCMSRTSTWQTAHRYGIYDKVTGAAPNLTGGFGFSYSEGSDTKRGYLGSWGAYFEDPATAFSTSSLTKTVTSNENNETYTLNWAPGKLEQRLLKTEALSTGAAGTVFKTHVPSYNAAGNAPGGPANFIVIKSGAAVYEGRYYQPNGTQITDPFGWFSGDDVIVAADLTANGGANAWLGNLHSEEKRANVMWDGSANIKFYSNTDRSADPTLLAAQYTRMTSTENRSPTANLPVAPLAFKNAADGWAHTVDDNINSSGKDYYFTGLTPPAGRLARTLYYDPSGNIDTVADAEDKAVMFNFSVNEKTAKYTPFDGSAVADLGNNWPAKNLNLQTAAGVLYEWRFGAYGWDNSIIATKADGSVYTIDRPMILKYVHDHTKDLNTGKTTVFYQNPGDDRNPVKTLCANETIATVDYQKCTVTPSAFPAAKEFYLEFDGNNLNGLPDMEAYSSVTDKNGYWAKLINPENGTEVTHVNDLGVSTLYVLKSLAVGKKFLPELPAAVSSVDGDGKLCDDIDFTDVATFGWDMSDLPAADAVPLSTSTWASKPTALKCSITNGVLPIAACLD